MLMNFVGTVGVLMANSGLKEVLCCAFGGVNKMLSGKKFPQNVRALRMVVEVLLQEALKTSSSEDNLMGVLENKFMKSRTTKHWFKNLIKPVLIMLLFILAEGEGDWPLHLYAVGGMMPYFFATGHFH